MHRGKARQRLASRIGKRAAKRHTVHLVGQTIAFCGLPTLAEARPAGRQHTEPYCDPPKPPMR